VVALAVIGAVSEEILDLEKCTKQLALNAVKNAKFHSSPQKASLFIVAIVIESSERIINYKNIYFLAA